MHTEHIESKGERSEAEHQERREGRGRLRRDSSSEELKRLHDEQVTALTKRLSSAEDVAKRLKMEKEKLERKLKETEEVAAQTELAAVQVQSAMCMCGQLSALLCFECVLLHILCTDATDVYIYVHV